MQRAKIRAMHLNIEIEDLKKKVHVNKDEVESKFSASFEIVSAGEYQSETGSFQIVDIPDVESSAGFSIVDYQP